MTQVGSINYSILSDPDGKGCYQFEHGGRDLIARLELPIDGKITDLEITDQKDPLTLLTVTRELLGSVLAILADVFPEAFGTKSIEDAISENPDIFPAEEVSKNVIPIRREHEDSLAWVSQSPPDPILDGPTIDLDALPPDTGVEALNWGFNTEEA